jgi:hypothetical protein
MLVVFDKFGTDKRDGMSWSCFSRGTGVSFTLSIHGIVQVKQSSRVGIHVRKGVTLVQAIKGAGFWQGKHGL